MPITPAALQPTDATSLKGVSGTIRDAADESSGPSFNRMLMDAADSLSSAAPVATPPVSQPKTALRPDAPAVKGQGKGRPQAEGSAAQPQPRQQKADTTDAGAEVVADTGLAKQAAPPIAPLPEPGLSSEQAEAKPAEKPAASTEAATVVPGPSLSAMVAVPAQVQQSQTQPQSQPERQVTAPQAATPAPVQPGVVRQDTQGDKFVNQSERSGQTPADVSATQSAPPASSRDDFAPVAADEAFSDGLEEALKKLDSHTGTGQPAAAPATSSAINPAMAGAGNERISQPQPSQQASQAQPVVAPEQQFVEANHGSIVNDIQTRLIPGGGSMQIRLSPPELGAMQVRVEMRGETLAATFQTSTDQAAQLLTSSLGQLKQALEQQGISVGRLQVVRTPQNDGARTGSDSGQSATQWQGYQQQQNDQRREVLRQLWNRVAYGRDPIDLMA